MDWFPDFILKYLSFTGKCFRHCEKPTSMKVISRDSANLVGAYVCPDGFVSQVVYFSLAPDQPWFEAMLSDQVGKENLSQRDIRVASRHGWELGGQAQGTLQSKLGERGAIREIYWTRYPKTDAQKQQAVSLCMGKVSRAGCMKLFIHDRNSLETLCPSCKAKYRE